MNQVVIFFVPVDADRHRFESALHGHLDSLAAVEAPEQNQKRRPAVDNEELPMWTWFLPNSRRGNS